MHHGAHQLLQLLQPKCPPPLSRIQMPPAKNTRSEICTSVPETMACHTQGLHNSNLHCDWCKHHSWWYCWCIHRYCIVYFYSHVGHTDAVWLGVVGALWTWTLSAFAMQMTIPITMFHGFPFASIMQADQLSMIMSGVLRMLVVGFVWRSGVWDVE